MIDLVTLIGVPIIATEYFCLGWYARKIYEANKFYDVVSEMICKNEEVFNDDKR